MVTTIQVSEELADELADRKGRGDTYEDVIWRALEAIGELADRAEEPVDGGAAETAPSGASSDGGERIRCEHCGNVWTTTSEAPRPSCSMCSKKTDRLLP